MTAFDRIIEKVLAHEGHYSRHPDDPGGETMFGVTQRTAVSHGYSGPMSAMSRETAVEIYRKTFWREIHGDELPEWLAFQVMDAAVHSGSPQAIRWLQRALGVTEDGLPGPKTLAAAQAADTLVGVRLLSYRLRTLAELPHWPGFGRGWSKRIAANMLELP